ncbi:hypothetical protein T09_4591 [Trichinella sp. T9]|nr:hypothetical protein T09_5220 [Trichinella sp. T9]KRX51340.1 hypothetical protein T09_4591 [Trichinella sp. T9]
MASKFSMCPSYYERKLNGIESHKVTFHVAIHPSISPERCSSLVFSINYKRQVDFIVNLFVSVKKMFMKPGPVNS